MKCISDSRGEAFLEAAGMTTSIFYLVRLSALSELKGLC